MSEYAIIENEKLKPQTNDNVVNLTLQTMEFGKQVLVFNNSKRSSEATAEKIANQIKNPENKEVLKKLAENILASVSSPTKQCRRLASIVEKGVAFHHSGLVGKQRSLIEKNFKEGVIKVISSTPTLAAGLNLPAYKVIIKDYKRYSQRGFSDIPILEFHQMAGRAGRPGKETIGKAVLCVKSDDELERVVPKYVFGEPEEIISKLAVEPTLKMYMLSLVSMDMINTKEEVVDFFSNTFYAHQYQDIESLKFNLFRILDILRDYDFIIFDDDYYMATELGKKVSELYLNPDTANYFMENIDKFIKIFSKENISKFDIYSLIYFVVNTMEMKPYFRVSKVEEDSYSKKAEEVGDSLVIGFDPFEMDYGDFLSLLKTTELFSDWINEAHEDFISEKFKVTPGELNYKIDVVDWLLYCLEELSLLKKNFYFKNYLNKLRVRFKHGIKEELLALISLKGVGRVRARKLYKNGFLKLLDLRKADTLKIAMVVGKSTAESIKFQVTNGELEPEIALETKKPKQIQVREIEVKEVTDDEIDILIENVEIYEKEKEEKQMKLSNFF
ncbi:MAG: hypothetical protein KC589_00625 [Nanoarchaeota archaeon]|nr:hypothetical protein [Nanoarchaeota archaeon]